VENRLQAWADRQTHDLPETELAKLRLAFAMGYPDWDAFTQELARHVEAVTQQFPQCSAARRVVLDASLAGLWREEGRGRRALPLLAEHGFEDPAQAWNRLRALREGSVTAP
jgi:glutamate-ammonia-ligase adenylyltransferase